jgi:hypothetical protein
MFFQSTTLRCPRSRLTGLLLVHRTGAEDNRSGGVSTITLSGIPALVASIGVPRLAAIERTLGYLLGQPWHIPNFYSHSIPNAKDKQGRIRTYVETHFPTKADLLDLIFPSGVIIPIYQFNILELLHSIADCIQPNDIAVLNGNPTPHKRGQLSLSELHPWRKIP